MSIPFNEQLDNLLSQIGEALKEELCKVDRNVLVKREHANFVAYTKPEFKAYVPKTFRNFSVVWKNIDDPIFSLDYQNSLLVIDETTLQWN
jgi:hypothetical protein